MQRLLKRDRRETGKLLFLPVGEIRTCATQPRRDFSREDLQPLAESIRRCGVLQPLTVRLRSGRYELVAGERRLRAARMAGLETVPCLLAGVDMEEAGILALAENLQRRDLSFAEEAEGISRLMRVFGLSQEEVAERLGRSQSAVANKLRLLRLPSDVLDRLCAAGLTERHGRALLRLETAQAQRDALARMIELGMNVAAAESYVEALLSGARDAAPAFPETPHGGQKTFVMKDFRLFYNTLSRALEVMRQSGVSSEVEKQERGGEVTLVIRLHRQECAAPETEAGRTSETI